MRPLGDAERRELEKDLDHFVFLHDVSWSDYEQLLRIRGDHSAPRITYLEGEVEIMSPSRSHEVIKSIIGHLVEVYCLEHDIEFLPAGSWTVKKKPAKRGAEPDECYLLRDVKNQTCPHLAIEVEWTSGRIDKQDVYRKLGVRETWYWRDGRIQPYLLWGERCRPITRSKALPGIDLDLIADLVMRPTANAAIREFRAHLRRRARG
jgi:Uma2 family endonuclease